MEHLLSAAGRAFLREFGAALLALGVGVAAAPTLHQAKLLAIAALIAAISAGLKAVQVFVPQISFHAWVRKPLGDWLDAFARAFIGTILVLLPGLMQAPDLSTLRTLATGLIVAAFGAGIRAVQGLLTPSDRPKLGSGLAVPPGEPAP